MKTAAYRKGHRISCRHQYFEEKKKKKICESKGHKLTSEYFEIIKERLNYVCVCCFSRLWFTKSVRLYTFDYFVEEGVITKFLKEVCFQENYDSIHVGNLCNTCSQDI